MKFTINIEGDALNTLRAIFPVEADFLRLTKKEMDELIDNHAQVFGMSETVRRISQLTGETTLYHVAIGKWAHVYAKLKEDLKNQSDMPLFQTCNVCNWTTEVA